MALPALAQFLGPDEQALGAGPDMTAAALEGQKSALASSDLYAKKQAQNYVTGNLKDITQRYEQNKQTAEDVANLAQYNPDLHKALTENQLARDKQATDQLTKNKDFLAGGILYVQHSDNPAQAWSDLQSASKAQGVDLGLFKDMPYSEQNAKIFASTLRGAKAIDDAYTLSKEDGAMVSRTPTGAIKEFKAEPTPQKTNPGWRMKTDDQGNPVIKQANVGGRTQSFAVEVDDQGNERISQKPLGLSVPPKAPPREAAPKLMTTYDDQGNPKYELVKPGMLPSGKPAQKGVQTNEDENKAAGWVVQAGNALDNMKRVLAGDPNADKAGFFETISPELLANQLRSATRQQFLQAASSFSEAALRAATGAGMNISEAKQKIGELTPVYGDKAEVIQQKLASIPLYLESLKARAGRALPRAEAALATAGKGNQPAPTPAVTTNMQHYQAALKAAAGNPAKIKAINDRARQMGLIQ